MWMSRSHAVRRTSPRTTSRSLPRQCAAARNVILILRSITMTIDYYYYCYYYCCSHYDYYILYFLRGSNVILRGSNIILRGSNTILRGSNTILRGIVVARGNHVSNTTRCTRYYYMHYCYSNSNVIVI